MAVPDIPSVGGAFFTGSVHVGALNGVALYQALLSQAGSAAPVATVLYNNLGTIVWTRTSAGFYVGTLTGAFLSGKTAVLISNGISSPSQIITASRTSDNDVSIKSWDTTGTPAFEDDWLNVATIQIMVFP